MYYLSMHCSRLRFKDIVLSSRFKGLAGLFTTEPPIVTCGSKKVPGKHCHPPANHLGWWAEPCGELTEQQGARKVLHKGPPTCGYVLVYYQSLLHSPVG